MNAPRSGPARMMTRLPVGFGSTLATLLESSMEPLVVPVAAFDENCARGFNPSPGSNDCPSSGAVYLFTRTATSWAKRAYVKGIEYPGLRFLRWRAIIGDAIIPVAQLSSLSAPTASVFPAIAIASPIRKEGYSAPLQVRTLLRCERVQIFCSFFTRSMRWLNRSRSEGATVIKPTPISPSRFQYTVACSILIGGSSLGT
jgi:hypothetical protein